MLLGARQFFERRGAPTPSVPTARDYVQDGLIAMWDGIENVGYGTHDDNATSWVDLTGGGANWLLKDSNTTEVFEVGSDYVKILRGLNYEGRGYCTPSWSSLDDLVCGEFVLDVSDVDTTTITNTRRIVGFNSSSTSNRSLWAQQGKLSCGFGQYPCVDCQSVTMAISLDFGVQTCIVNGISVISASKGSGWIGMRGPSISGYGFGDDYCAIGAKIKALRIYGRSPTDAERLANYAIDKARFNLP